MDRQDKIEKYLLNEMSEAEKADFLIDMHNDPSLKEEVELESQIIKQIQNKAFVDNQIDKAKEELRQEKFERFLTDEMTESEKANFEKELKNNTILKEQVDLEAKIVEQIKDSAFVNSQINTAQNEIKQGRSIRMRFYAITSVAALFILVIVMPFLYRTIKYNNLYAENYTTINVNDSSEILRGIGPEKRFHLAINNMEEGEYSDAQKQLEELLDQPRNFSFYEETRWYLALVHLKLHHKSKVKSYLEEVISLDGKYKIKSLELLDEL